MELSDLPPRYQAQVEKQLAERAKKRSDPMAVAIRVAKTEGRDFDSMGEYEFYTGVVLPGIAAGRIKACELHPRFVLFPEGAYGGIKLGEIQYTADFRLDCADGTVEIVEVKSKFVRKMQRDYPVRRRIFIETIARPAGWKFREIITADSRDEIKRWQALVKAFGGEVATAISRPEGDTREVK